MNQCGNRGESLGPCQSPCTLACPVQILNILLEYKKTHYASDLGDEAKRARRQNRDSETCQNWHNLIIKYGKDVIKCHTHKTQFFLI